MLYNYITNQFLTILKDTEVLCVKMPCKLGTLNITELFIVFV